MNPFEFDAARFSHRYRAQMGAANNQARADQSADSAFSELMSDDQRSMIGAPLPQAAAAPGDQYDGFNEEVGAIQAINAENIATRAKRRAQKYLRNGDSVTMMPVA